MNSNRSPVFCATDFSDRARGAATVAAKLALQRSEPLLLVHVAASLDGGIRAAAQAQLEREAQRLRRTGGTVAVALLEGATPARVFLELVRKEQPSMVAVASRCKAPVDRWTLGSFSERVAQSAPVPTLVVYDPEPFRTWGWAGTSLKILAALDLHTDSDAVLRYIKALGHGLGASSALHGSVVKAVLKKLRRPVLVIRRPDE